MSFSLPWELIVVDNGSTDGTDAVLEEFSRSFGETLRVLHEPRLGLAHARNRGLSVASGEVVAFTDDDCYPARTWLARIHDCFAEHPALGFLGGQIRLYDDADLPLTILLVEDRMEYSPPSFIRPGAIQGANMAFRRRALEEIGGFDVRLGAGTAFPCEDIDAVARVSSAGWHGAYDPRPLVFHHHGRRSPDEVRTLYRSYLRGAGAHYAKCLADRRLRAGCTRFLGRRVREKPQYAVRELKGMLEYWLDGFRPARPDASRQLETLP
jgi:GT2 family glycosyltransferase